jgi:hypothetical protein
MPTATDEEGCPQLDGTLSEPKVLPNELMFNAGVGWLQASVASLS